jgi:hypothetical protein
MRALNQDGGAAYGDIFLLTWGREMVMLMLAGLHEKRVGQLGI